MTTTNHDAGSTKLQNPGSKKIQNPKNQKWSLDFIAAPQASL